MGELNGQVALVTGGGRGIGRAIAQGFAVAGAAVMVTARTGDELTETVALITAEGGRAAALPADVTDTTAFAAVLDATERQLGPVTLLVNNAGGGSPGSGGPFETLDPAAITRSIEVNLLSAMLCTRLVLPGMLARRTGRVINVASGAGLIGVPYLNAYSVAKTGLIRFSENLALELQGRGVAVFAITPGAVRTPGTEGLWQVRKLLGTGAPFPGAPAWLTKLSIYGPRENLLLDATWQPPERAAALCCFLAAGHADPLSGRFFSTYFDEAEIVMRAEEVEREMLYTLRLPSLQGLERPTTPGDLDGISHHEVR